MTQMIHSTFNFVTNIFRSQESKDDIKRQLDILSRKQSSVRSPHPRKNITFPEENFIALEVEQKGEKIKIANYRYPFNSSKYEKPEGIIIQFHGLYNHANTGAHIAQYMAEQGFTTVAIDYRGHGKSGGIKGLYESQEIHLSDCRTFVQKVEQIYPSSPLFLCGYSLGGQTSFLLGLEEPQKYCGIILFAPAIKDMKEHAKIEKFACRLVGKKLPQKRYVKQGGEGGTSRNKQVEIENEDDPLMYNDAIFLHTVAECLRVSDECEKLYEQFHNPFLIIQGGSDKWIDPKVCSELIKRSPSTDKSFLYYEDMWHNIWVEQEIQEIIPKVHNWIKARSNREKVF